MDKTTTINVLISGGTGFVGGHLTHLLQSKGYNVAYLSRSSGAEGEVKVFQWDINSNYVEEGAIQWADFIIHLAGANIADKRWTEKRKKVIRDSRVKTAELLIDRLHKEKHSVKAVISASGVGYYGDSGDTCQNEDALPADDFFGKTGVAWEGSVLKARDAGLRVCIFRTGMVLARDGGALPSLVKPIKLFAGAPLGTGKQFMSWIHIEDLCSLYLKAIEDDNMNGIFNAVAPNPVTNAEFTQTIAEVLNKPLFLPPVPEFVLKLVLGEMADVVLISSRVSNKKILKTGFQFKFEKLKNALEDIYKWF